MTMNWQPIETAPKDGVWIILFRPTLDAKWQAVSVGKYENQRYSAKPRPYWKSIWGGSLVQNDRAHVPTHWMPLPEPPCEEDAAE